MDLDTVVTASVVVTACTVGAVVTAPMDLALRSRRRHRSVVTAMSCPVRSHRSVVTAMSVAILEHMLTSQGALRAGSDGRN